FSIIYRLTVNGDVNLVTMEKKVELDLKK
ncbi:hypothetical protein HMPREF1202_00463, partial [[Ruminococcus] lactaris CC59_002D]